MAEAYDVLVAPHCRFRPDRPRGPSLQTRLRRSPNFSHPGTAPVKDIGYSDSGRTAGLPRPRRHAPSPSATATSTDPTAREVSASTIDEDSGQRPPPTRATAGATPVWRDTDGSLASWVARGQVQAGRPLRAASGPGRPPRPHPLRPVRPLRRRSGLRAIRGDRGPHRPRRAGGRPRRAVPAGAVRLLRRLAQEDADQPAAMIAVRAGGADSPEE